MKKLAIAIASVLLVGTVQAEVVSHGLTFDTCHDFDIPVNGKTVWVHACSKGERHLIWNERLNCFTDIFLDEKNKNMAWLLFTNKDDSRMYGVVYRKETREVKIVKMVRLDKPFFQGKATNLPVPEEFSKFVPVPNDGSNLSTAYDLLYGNHP